MLNPLPGHRDPDLPRNKDVTLASVGGVERDPTAPRGWAGNGEFQEGWGRRYCLRSPGIPLRSPPKRTCLANSESSPTTKRGCVCKYSLKWKHRDCASHGHASRMVTSAPGMKASRVVRGRPSRPGATPLIQPVHRRCRLQSGAWVGVSVAKRSVPR